MEFKELLEEYTSNLEKDYDSNQKENSNHPVFSLCLVLEKPYTFG